MSLVALDTNILVYEAGLLKVEEDRRKIDITRATLTALSDRHQLFAPFQALGEFYGVLLRAGRTRPEAEEAVRFMRSRLVCRAAREEAFGSAFQLATEHHLQFWDALVVATSVEARCPILLSEDMGHGFAWRGLTVINPFAEDTDPRLARLLG